MRRRLTGYKCSTLLCAVTRIATNAVMPHRCVFCGTRLYDTELHVCCDCYADLPWINRSCARCAQPVPAALPEGTHCADCQLRPTPFGTAVAPLMYSFPVDAAIKALKFRRKLYYAPAFAALLENELPRLGGDIDAVLPVPLHWRRHANRGFNQAAELCRRVQICRGLPVLVNVIRQRPTPYQSGLDSEQRQRNLRGAFVVRGDIDARHILIVDDVITTGETCRQLARTLLDSGAGAVSVLAVARAVIPRALEKASQQHCTELRKGETGGER